MPNVFEAITNTVKTLVDNEPKSPLHVGEAMSCWTYYVALAAADAFEQAALNTTTDDELKSTLQEALQMCKAQTEQLENFMMHEGVSLPPVQQEKPDSDPDAVPLGVKMTDDEIANGLSIKVAGSFVAAAAAASQAIRNDVALMWFNFMSQEAVFGATLKTMMRKRGWLKVPPYYYPPGAPTQEQ